MNSIQSTDKALSELGMQYNILDYEGKFTIQDDNHFNNALELLRRVSLFLIALGQMDLMKIVRGYHPDYHKHNDGTGILIERPKGLYYDKIDKTNPESPYHFSDILRSVDLHMLDIHETDPRYIYLEISNRLRRVFSNQPVDLGIQTWVETLDGKWRLAGLGESRNIQYIRRQYLRSRKRLLNSKQSEIEEL